MTTPTLTLQLGSRGKFVRALQTALNVRRPSGSTPLVVDGQCGPKTLDAAAAALRVPSVRSLTQPLIRRLGVNVVLLADLSGHNEGGNKRPVDIDRMAAAGVHGAWLKLTEGTTYQNTEAIRQAHAARGVMLRGGYHFADPSADRTGLDVTALLDDAGREAAHYLAARAQTFGSASPELADVLDLEQGLNAKLSARVIAAMTPGRANRHEMTARWCLRWLEAVDQATGRKPWIYLPRWAYDSFLSLAPVELLADLRTYRHWLASYNSGEEPTRKLPDEWGEPSAWQFTGTGKVDGVDGDCDLSWALAEDLAL